MGANDEAIRASILNIHDVIAGTLRFLQVLNPKMRSTCKWYSACETKDSDFLLIL